jgi:hypothetical protein
VSAFAALRQHARRNNVSPRPPFIVTVNGANVVIVSGGQDGDARPRSPPEHARDPTGGR